MNLLYRLNLEHRTTLLMVTHNPDLELYADRILFVEDGYVIIIWWWWWWWWWLYPFILWIRFYSYHHWLYHDWRGILWMQENMCSGNQRDASLAWSRWIFETTNMIWLNDSSRSGLIMIAHLNKQNNDSIIFIVMMVMVMVTVMVTAMVTPDGDGDGDGHHECVIITRVTWHCVAGIQLTHDKWRWPSPSHCHTRLIHEYCYSTVCVCVCVCVCVIVNCVCMFWCRDPHILWSIVAAKSQSCTIFFETRSWVARRSEVWLSEW